MKRDKKFVIDSIKMDLYRVVTATGDVRKEIPMESVKEFLNHAQSDFEKIDLTPKENMLKTKLETLSSQTSLLTDPSFRLRWTEDILTTRSRL